jgi:hypothetical protein
MVDSRGQCIVSRRGALAVMGSVLWPWPRVIGSERAVPRFSFVVVSDTHVGREDKAEAARVWERTAREIDGAAGEFVLHLGDLVDGRREAQYPVYLEGRKRISKPGV